MKSIILALLSLFCTAVWSETAEDSTLQPLALKLFSYEDENYAMGLYDKVTWLQAELICASKDYTLVSISSQSLQDNLINWIETVEFDDLELLEEEPLWTSGTNQGDNSEYTWQGNGKSVFYNNFVTGPPTETPRCLGINGATGIWSDHDCTEQHYFICEKVQNAAKC